MRTILPLLLCLYSCFSLAGGDYVRGHIIEYSEIAGNYQFKFEPSDQRQALFKECRIISVQVSYTHVPWYSWLPYVHTTHPTKKQTMAAVKFILNSYHQNGELFFGYMGAGLVSSQVPCSFSSKGLLLENRDDDVPIVLSFSHPV